jgi:hypothetical protein
MSCRYDVVATPRERLGLALHAVNIVGVQNRGTGPMREHRKATGESHIRVGNAPEQGLGELIHPLAGLVCQLSEACFDLCVYGDGRCWHVDSPNSLLILA